MQFGNIKGSTSDKNHKNWIELQSCHYSSIRSVTQETGSNNRSVAKPSVSHLSITKEMNISTQGIFKEAHDGHGTDVCTIHFVNDKGVFLEYKLHKAVLADYEVTLATDSNVIHETFNIHFTVIDSRHTPSEPGNVPSSAGYDIQKGQCL